MRPNDFEARVRRALDDAPTHMDALVTKTHAEEWTTYLTGALFPSTRLEPTEPGWYAYSGGAQSMVFHLRLSPDGARWSAHFDNGCAADCAWGYIEQALGVWELVRVAARPR